MAPSAGYDPLIDLPMAQAAKPAELGPVNLRTLTPFQRALLVIDGTVTKFIEAYTMEPIEVVRLAQQNIPLEEDHRWLEARSGTVVAVREAVLRGRYSHTFYAYARSWIVPDRLSPEVAERIQVDGEGLGRILNDHDTETRREVLWYGRERTTDLPEVVLRATGGEFISRTYRIIARKRPIMLITEKFPVATDELPAHH